ncbi:MAG TPA: hypothetical protein VGM44_17350 [Polyangiaceae bacterium]|jgi:hypothetical protein
MSDKQRLSASVDREVLAAAQAAVAGGSAANISEWVNRALHRQAEHDQRMRALDQFLAAYEQEHGVITEAEIQSATRSARARAVVVRGTKRRASQSARRRSGAR